MKSSTSFKKGKDHPLFGKHLSAEYKEKVSNGLKGHSVSKETREKIGNANRGKRASDQTKIKLSAAQKGRKHWRWQEKIEISCVVCGKGKLVLASRIANGRGKCCSYKCNGIRSMKLSKREDTKIEKLIENELIKRGIPYGKQIPLLGITLVDFLLPGKIVIYCDGDYWHRKPDVKVRDCVQNGKLRDSGYSVFRLPEHEINKSPGSCIEKILRTHDDLPWVKKMNLENQFIKEETK